MSYRPETILKRTDPQDDEYDEVRIIGQALVSTNGPRTANWGGSDAEHWSIAPVGFGTPIDKPLGQLNEEYEIVSEPELPKRVNLGERPAQHIPGPSPEEAFKRTAHAEGQKQSPQREPTALEPTTTTAKTPSKS